MMKILLPFIKDSWRFYLFSLIAAILGLVVAKVFDFEEWSLAVYAVPFIWLVVATSSIAGNLSWLLSAPISKNRLMLVSALFNLAAMALSLVQLVVLAVAHLTLYSQWERFFQKRSELLEALESRTEPLITFSPSETAFIAFGLCFGFAVMFPQGNFMKNILQSRTGSESDRWQQTKGVLKLVLFLTLAIFLYNQLTSPMLLSALLIIGVPFWLVRNAVHSVGFSRSYRFAWLGITVIFCVIGTLAVYLRAQYRLNNDEKISHQYDAATFMGALTGTGKYKRVLEEFMKQDLPAEEAYSAARNYSNISGGLYNYWLDQTQSELKFTDVIKKSNMGAVESTASLFRPKTLSKADLAAYVGVLPSLQRGTNYQERQALRPTVWIYQDLSEPEVIELLRSPHPDVLKIGLAYARFHPKQSFLEEIAMRIRKGIPDECAESAVLTLSIWTDLENRVTELPRIAGESPRAFRMKALSCESYKAWRELRDQKRLKGKDRKFGGHWRVEAQCARIMALAQEDKYFNSVTVADELGRRNGPGWRDW